MLDWNSHQPRNPIFQRPRFDVETLAFSNQLNAGEARYIDMTYQPKNVQSWVKTSYGKPLKSILKNKKKSVFPPLKLVNDINRLECIRCKGDHSSIHCRAIRHQRVPGPQRHRIASPHEKTYIQYGSKDYQHPCDCCDHDTRRISHRDDSAYAEYLRFIAKRSAYESLESLIYLFGNVPVPILTKIKEETEYQLMEMASFDYYQKELCEFRITSIVRSVWIRNVSQILPKCLGPNRKFSCNKQC